MDVKRAVQRNVTGRKNWNSLPSFSTSGINLVSFHDVEKKEHDNAYVKDSTNDLIRIDMSTFAKPNSLALGQSRKNLHLFKKVDVSQIENDDEHSLISGISQYTMDEPKSKRIESSADDHKSTVSINKSESNLTIITTAIKENPENNLKECILPEKKVNSVVNFRFVSGQRLVRGYSIVQRQNSANIESVPCSDVEAITFDMPYNLRKSNELTDVIMYTDNPRRMSVSSSSAVSSTDSHLSIAMHGRSTQQRMRGYTIREDEDIPSNNLTPEKSQSSSSSGSPTRKHISPCKVVSSPGKATLTLKKGVDLEKRNSICTTRSLRSTRSTTSQSSRSNKSAQTKATITTKSSNTTKNNSSYKIQNKVDDKSLRIRNNEPQKIPEIQSLPKGNNERILTHKKSSKSNQENFRNWRTSSNNKDVSNNVRSKSQGKTTSHWFFFTKIQESDIRSIVKALNLTGK